MGWSIGGCHKHDRDIGYGVVAWCDHPDCDEEIDRGISYLCGDIHKDGGCGLHFCEKHRSNYMSRKEIMVCDRCYKSRKPFAAKPDHHKWMRWKLREDSWQIWRDENPAKCEEMLKHLRKLKRDGVIDMIFGDKREITDLAMQCIDHALNRFNKKFIITLGDDISPYQQGENTEIDPYKFKIKISTQLVPTDPIPIHNSAWHLNINASYDGDMISICGDEQQWDISNQYEVTNIVMTALLASLSNSIAYNQAAACSSKPQ